MRRAIWNKYPKFLLLVLTIVPAFIIFYERNIPWVHDGVVGLGLTGAFLGGALYSFGFSAATATAVLLIIGSQNNIILSAVVAGLGGVASDYIIFKFVRFSFKDEVRHLKKERLVRMLASWAPAMIRPHLLTLLGAAIIASPLPDELGVSLIAFSERLTLWQFLVLSYVLNTAGALLVLAIGRAYV
mgnify:FL=1